MNQMFTHKIQYKFSFTNLQNWAQTELKRVKHIKSMS